MSPTLDLSIVVVSHNEGGLLRQTVHNLLATMPARGEIIVVDDGSSDGSAEVFGTGYSGVTVVRPAARLGIAAARNFGAQAAQGEILAFCDAHVEAPMNWFAPLRAALDSPQAGAAAPAISVMGSPTALGYGLRWKDDALNVEWLPKQANTPYNVPLVSACFMALRRERFDCVGGFDGGLRGRGSTDSELCLRLWTLGYECILVPLVEVAHLFRTSYPYEVDQAAIVHNLLRVGVVHFGEDRLRREIDSLRNQRDFAAAYALLTASDAGERRAAVQAARLHDDEWFFRHFGG